MVIVRAIKENDAADFLALCQTLDQETQFRLLEPGERATTAEEQRERIGNILSRDNQTIFVVEINKQLVGYLSATGGSFSRNRHTVYIVIGILQSITGKGIGKRLFIELEKWADEQKIYRLELTVMVHNERAIKLYKKMGFEIEGKKKHSLLLNGSYIDEYYMAKLLI